MWCPEGSWEIVRTLYTLWRREMKAYFYGSSAYVVTALFLWLMGGSFWMLVNMLSQGPATVGVLPMLLGESVFFWLAMLAVVPVITMRLIAEEKRSGTLETLLTAPIGNTMLVASKFLAAYTMFGLIWLPMMLYPFLLNHAGLGSGLFIDPGALFAAYLGIACMGAFFVSIGLLASSITPSQSIAAICTFAMMCAIFFGGFTHYYAQTVALQELGRFTSPLIHMADFARGVIDTRVLVLYMSATWLALFLAVKVVESRQWRLSR